MIEKLWIDQIQTYQENMNQKIWLLHWILVYSFTTKNESLFASLVTDNTNYGQSFLNIVEIKS